MKNSQQFIVHVHQRCLTLEAVDFHPEVPPISPGFFHLNLIHALTLACCFLVQQETRSG